MDKRRNSGRTRDRQSQRKRASPAGAPDTEVAATPPPLSRETAGTGPAVVNSQPDPATLATISFDQGKRRMRQYPLTESELTALGNTGAAATACFSIGGALVGFSVNLYKDTKLAQGLTADQVAMAGTINTACLVVGICFLVVGAVLFLYGRRTLDKIKAETTFNDGLPPFVIPNWQALIFRSSVVLVLLLVGIAIGLFYR